MDTGRWMGSERKGQRTEREHLAAWMRADGRAPVAWGARVVGGRGHMKESHSRCSVQLPRAEGTSGSPGKLAKPCPAVPAVCTVHGPAGPPGSRKGLVRSSSLSVLSRNAAARSAQVSGREAPPPPPAPAPPPSAPPPAAAPPAALCCTADTRACLRCRWAARRWQGHGEPGSDCGGPFPGGHTGSVSSTDCNVPTQRRSFLDSPVLFCILPII